MWDRNHVKREDEKEQGGGSGRRSKRVQPCAGVYTCTQNRCFPPHLQAPWLGTATLAFPRQRLAYPPSEQLRLWVKWWLIRQQESHRLEADGSTPFLTLHPLVYTRICVYCTHTVRKQNWITHWRINRRSLEIYLVFYLFSKLWRNFSD